MKQFKEATSVLRHLHERGFEAYFVGGSVRDYILGRPLGDIDIATSAFPDEVMTIFPHNVPVGIEHGTVIVIHGGIPYEVTTFRVEEGYDDFRHPTGVTFVRSLHEDLKRRDFTMNAIAMTEEGELIDPFSGKKAIAEQRIETVGNPHERFKEDALRLMRGVRFVSTLGFTLHKETKDAMMENMHLLHHVAIERIAVEFEKLLLGQFVTKALPLLVEVQLHDYLPEFKNKQDYFLRAASYDWSSIENEVEAWSLLLYILEIDNETEILKKWKLSSKKMKRITTILFYLQERLIREWDEMLLYKAGEETAEMAEKLFGIVSRRTSLYDTKSKIEALPIHSRKELNVTGNDMLQWSKKKAGPWVADVLEEAERAVVFGRVANSREDIKEWLIACNLL